MIEAIYYLRRPSRPAREHARIIEEIRTYQQETSQAVLDYIVDIIALDLLKRAQLTDGNGGEGEYYHRVEQLSYKLDKIHDYTSRKSLLATQRLAGSLNGKIGTGIMAKKVPTLRIREELLDVETLMLKDKKLSESLTNKREELEEFAEILLRAMGEEIPTTIDLEMRTRPVGMQQFGDLSYQESREQRETQVLMSTSVAVALRMVVAMPEKDMVTSLWERYDELDYHITDEFSGLKPLLESMKKQVTAHIRIQNNQVGAIVAPATSTTTEDDILALAGYTLAQWGQMLWEYRDKELQTMLTSNSIIHHLQQEDYDPQTVRSLLATHTVVTGPSSRAGQPGELCMLMFPSVERQQYFQEMHLEPHFRDIPDTERLLLLYISQYVAPPQYIMDDTPPANQAGGDTANGQQAQVPPEKKEEPPAQHNVDDTHATGQPVQATPTNQQGQGASDEQAASATLPEPTADTASTDQLEQAAPTVPSALLDPQLTRNFQRYENDLAYFIKGPPDPSIAIDDPDLDLPIRARLAQIQSEPDALKTYVNKHLTAWKKFADQLAADPTSGLYAFALAKHGFAIRAGEQALGIPAEQLFLWPEQMRELLGQVQDTDLQQLVKEDMVY